MAETEQVLFAGVTNDREETSFVHRCEKWLGLNKFCSHVSKMAEIEQVLFTGVHVHD